MFLQQTNKTINYKPQLEKLHLKRTSSCGRKFSMCTVHVQRKLAAHSVFLHVVHLCLCFWRSVLFLPKTPHSLSLLLQHLLTDPNVLRTNASWVLNETGGKNVLSRTRLREASFPFLSRFLFLFFAVWTGLKVTGWLQACLFMSQLNSKYRIYEI